MVPMNPEELASGVQTVVQLAGYFRELKSRAAKLAQRIAPQPRGYFTAAEEEQTTALLVSYWKARNALFELITSYRADTRLEGESQRRAFITAFAAAVILVDAARVLRELADTRPVVRQKLNEPVSQFGVPGGVYDRVQHSLLSARHGWHLYHALRYFDDHQAELRRLGTDPGYAELLGVIDALRPRLSVSLAQFGAARFRTRANHAARQLAGDLLGQALYGLQKLVGTLVADKYLRYGHRPQLPAAIATYIEALLAPGDVLVVRKEYALTNYFLPGHWPHAALYLGRLDALAALGLPQHEHVQPRWKKLLEAASETPHRVMESMRDGVRIRSLGSPFASDSIVVLRPQLSPAEIAQALGRVLSHEGKGYDFDFDFRRSDRLVCTEVVYRAYDGIGALQIPLVWRAGRPTLSGSDLIRLSIRREAFVPIAVYAPAFSPHPLTGPSVTPILQTAEGQTP